MTTMRLRHSLGVLVCTALFAAGSVTAAHADTTIESRTVTRVELQQIKQSEQRPETRQGVEDFRREHGISSAVAFDVPNLNSGVIERYQQWITWSSAEARYETSIPAKYFFLDPEGAWAAIRAVNTSNRAIAQQLELTGRPAQVQYSYGQPIPMGEHAHFTPLWWGMTFTLDAQAAEVLNTALAVVGTVADVVGALGTIGVVMGPEVTAIIGAVVLVVKTAISMVRNCTTENGLVLRALWLPIPWCEKPASPFQRAPELDGSAPAQPTPTAVPAPSPSGIPGGPQMPPGVDPTVVPSQSAWPTNP